MNKIGIIAVARNEERYIREWVEHHLKLGFDEILLADNDDTFLLPDVISNPALTHLDYTSSAWTQPDIYTGLYLENRDRFDWLMYIDCDEFVMLDGYASIGEFMEGFDCDVVRLSNKHYSDGDMLDTDGDYRVVERFTEQYLCGLDTFTKSLINTRVELGERRICGHSIYNPKLDARNALGDPCENKDQRTNRIVHSRCWVNHYPTKTIGEYVRQKYNRGGINHNPRRYSEWEKYFFRTNRKTQEKIDYANKLIKELYD